MRRPELKYEVEEEDAVGGRRCPAENGELLRRDDDDDGRDDIARGSRGSFAPVRRLWRGACPCTPAAAAACSTGRVGRRPSGRGRYREVRGSTWPAPKEVSGHGVAGF